MFEPFRCRFGTVILAASLLLSASAVAERTLPGAGRGAADIPMQSGTESCDVLFQAVHTPLSRDGLHTLLFFRISTARALSFHDHVPGLTEIRAKASLFVMSPTDMLGVARESGRAEALRHAHAN